MNYFAFFSQRKWAVLSINQDIEGNSIIEFLLELQVLCEKTFKIKTFSMKNERPTPKIHGNKKKYVRLFPPQLLYTKKNYVLHLLSISFFFPRQANHQEKFTTRGRPLAPTKHATQ